MCKSLCVCLCEREIVCVCAYVHVHTGLCGNAGVHMFEWKVLQSKQGNKKKKINGRRNDPKIVMAVRKMLMHLNLLEIAFCSWHS